MRRVFTSVLPLTFPLHACVNQAASASVKASSAASKPPTQQAIRACKGLITTKTIKSVPPKAQDAKTRGTKGNTSTATKKK